MRVYNLTSKEIHFRKTIIPAHGFSDLPDSDMPDRDAALAGSRGPLAFHKRPAWYLDWLRERESPRLLPPPSEVKVDPVVALDQSSAQDNMSKSQDLGDDGRPQGMRRKNR